MALTSLGSLLSRAETEFAGINAKELNLTIIKLKTKRKRIGLLAHACKHLGTYGPDVNLLIDPPSSEEVSGDEHFETSYRSAADHLLDTSQLRKKPKGEGVEKWLQNCAAPTLVVMSLEKHLTLHGFRKAVSKASSGVRKTAILELEDGEKQLRCGVVVLKSAAEAGRLARKWEKMKEKGELAGFLHGMRGLSRPISLMYFDYEAYAQDRQWAGVVLRNLPSKSSQESLRELTAQFHIPIKRIEKPKTLLGGSVCSLLVVEDFETAERLCMKMNRLEVDQRKVKAHIHPDTCLDRPADSHHRIFHVSELGAKRPKKSQDAGEQAGDSQATTRVGEQSAHAEALTLSLESEDPCRVPGIPVREFAGESYSQAYGWAKHSGATIICKLPGSA